MPFFRVDDTFHANPKTIALRADPEGGQPAIGTWALCGSWCGEHLTNGRLSLSVVQHLGGTEAHAEALVRCRLWDRRKGAYLFHNWAKWNPTKKQTLAKRKANADRLARWRAEHTGNGVGNGVTDPFVTLPPSRPVPIPKKRESRSPSAVGRASFVPTSTTADRDGLKTGPSADERRKRWTENGPEQLVNGNWERIDVVK